MKLNLSNAQDFLLLKDYVLSADLVGFPLGPLTQELAASTESFLPIGFNA